MTGLKLKGWGTWVAQFVKHLTLDFTSGHNLMVGRFESHIELCCDSVEPTWDSLPIPHFIYFSKVLETKRWTKTYHVNTNQEKVGIRGTWLAQLSIELWLRPWSPGLWVWAPSWALCWWCRAWDSVPPWLMFSLSQSGNSFVLLSVKFAWSNYATSNLYPIIKRPILQEALTSLWGAWVAQLVKHPALESLLISWSQGHGFQPHVGLCTVHGS